MKIAINGLSARYGGGAAYLQNLLEQLSEIDRDNEYMVFVCPERYASLAHITKSPNFNITTPRFPGKAVIRRTIWEQAILPALVKKHKIDILFSPGGIAPVIVPDSCKRVNLVQNMAPFSDELLNSYSHSRRKMRFLMLRRLYPFFAGRADANIFISMAGRDALQQYVDIDEKSSKVIYHGRSKIFSPVPINTAKEFIHKQYDINEKFILYVSNIARYKNQLEVIAAYHIARKRGANTGKLVLAGIIVEPSYYREAMTLVDNLKIRDEVIYLGQLPQNHLPYLYSAASIFVFASICENCPNILIEAMACGAPIIASNVPPMPEICGSAALYFDPITPNAIAEKMCQVLGEEKLRQNLIGDSVKNAMKFSWNQAAQSTLEVFKETAFGLSKSGD